MTRARAEDYEEKKKGILDKAAALIARKGFDVATMMDVAKACGTSKSHLYHYFPSKEKLLFAIVYEHITQQVEDIRRLVSQPGSAEERFERFVDSFVRGAARSRNEHVMLMNDLKFLPKAQRDHIISLEIELARILVELLREINPALMAEERVQTPYALLLFGMMIWTFTWYKRNGSITPKELAQRISQLYVNGFKGLPAD